jgi:alkylation response protein AidB-like acyl-CoA dehydrogenase
LIQDSVTAGLDSFRATVGVWLNENLPASLRGNPNAVASAMVDGAFQSDDVKLWRRRMGKKGWGVATWPRRYGGGGLSPAEAAVLNEELNLIGTRNPIGGLGVMMFGPTLLEYGNEQQLQRHIPPIAKGELRWCQGFSEPGAGSDLASLQTRAEDKGDHFLVDGQKVWTTGAQYADWCFCLVRTDKTRKHDGISFLLIDMKSPGVDVRPIKLISGNSPFCETFFTDVKVPKDNLVGPLNAGWSIAKRLLQHERQATSGGGSSSPIGVQPTQSIAELAKSCIGVNEAGRLKDADLRARITAHLMEARAFELTYARAIEESRTNSGTSAVSSILKNVGAKVRQDRAELAVEALGHQGLGWGGPGFEDDELANTRTWLLGKSGSIAGGSHEIQNNIIAKRILGLPDSSRSG